MNGTKLMLFSLLTLAACNNVVYAGDTISGGLQQIGHATAQHLHNAAEQVQEVIHPNPPITVRIKNKLPALTTVAQVTTTIAAIIAIIALVPHAAKNVKDGWDGAKGLCSKN